MTELRAADTADQFAVLVHRIRALAQQELFYANGNVHQERRGRELLKIASELAALDGQIDAAALELRYLSEAPSLSPYSGVDGAVVDDMRRILLIRREDDGLWAMPGGGSDVGETPAQTATRELFEEAGIQSRAIALVGVYDSRLCGTRSWAHLDHFVFLCEAEPDAIPHPGPETTDVGWFSADELPPLSPGHSMRIADVFNFVSTSRRWAFFDRTSE
jgi:8-oxo-dGTP pyrophosphatase MutT (NUDIX family)